MCLVTNQQYTTGHFFQGMKEGASLESRLVDISGNSCLIMSLNITSVIYWEKVGEASSAAHFRKNVPHMDWNESEDRNWWKFPHIFSLLTHMLE